MNRRTAIRNVVIISAGAAFIPACGQQDQATITLKNISFSGSEEKMLAALTEAIIPKTKNFIGAGDLRAHEFALVMVDDCASPEDQKKFMGGMKEFEEACKKKWKTSFVKCTSEEKKEILQQMEKNDDIPEAARNFYKTIKRYTVQSFTTSKQFLLDIKKYQLVPGGNFKGCVPVKKDKV